MPKSHCESCVKNDEDCCSSFYARFVTLGDAQRISKFLGRRPSKFIKFAGLSRHDMKTDLFAEKHHSYYYDLVTGGKILQLRTKRDGSCMFFRKGSCRVYPARPLACRVFPFWFSKHGKVIVDNNGLDCPIICGKSPLNRNATNAEIRKGIRKIGYSTREMDSTLSTLRKEIEEYKSGVNSFVRENGL
jgi:Fe-S-cluster containining protein